MRVFLLFAGFFLAGMPLSANDDAPPRSPEIDKARANMTYAYQQASDAVTRVNECSETLENAKMKVAQAQTIEAYRAAMAEQGKGEKTLASAQAVLQPSLDVYQRTRNNYLKSKDRYQALNGADYPDGGPLPATPYGHVPMRGAGLVSGSGFATGFAAAKPKPPPVAPKMNLPPVSQFDRADPAAPGVDGVSYNRPGVRGVMPPRQDTTQSEEAAMRSRPWGRKPAQGPSDENTPAPQDEAVIDQAKVQIVYEDKKEGVPLVPALEPIQKPRPLPGPVQAPEKLSDAQILIGVAENKLAEGNFLGALKDAESVIRQDSKDASGWLLKAKAFDALGQHAQAEAAALKSVHLAPDYAAAHEVLAWSRFNQGRVEEAVQSLATAARLDPNGDLARAYRDFVQSRGQKEGVEISTDTVAIALRSGSLPAPPQLGAQAQKPPAGKASGQAVYKADRPKLLLWGILFLCAAGASGALFLLFRKPEKKA